MANWTTPIFDRTTQDITYAKQKFKEWRLNPPTEYEILKGCFNYTDMNRIEENTQYLYDYLTSYGYIISLYGTPKYDWAVNNIPIKNNIDKLLANIYNIKNGFVNIAEWETLPLTISTFEDVNIIERDINYIKIYSTYIQDRFCNTFSAGQSFFLPFSKM